MQLTASEVIFLEAHDIHCPLHAKEVIKKVIAIKKDKKPIDPKLSMLAGLCQKVIVDKNRFKKLYKSAYCQGLFNPAQAISTRHMLT